MKNAKALAEGLLSNSFRLVSGGTDTHLMLVDLRPKKITGKIAETVLDEVGVTVNKNTVPFDPEKPFVTSGIRIGTPALTTRGMKEAEMKKIADMIGKVLSNVEDEAVKKEVASAVRDLCRQFPLYS